MPRTYLTHLCRMLKAKPLSFLILFCSLFFTPAVLPGNDPQQLQFSMAVKLYDSFQFSEALLKFESLSAGDNPYKGVSVLFSAKCLIKLNRAAQAEDKLTRLLNTYKGRYADESRLTLSEVYFLQKKYKSAFNELITLSAVSADPFYKTYADSTAKELAYNYLSSSDVRGIYETTSAVTQKGLLKFIEGKLYLGENNLKDARLAFLEVLQLYPRSREKDEAQKLYIETIGKVDTEVSGTVFAALLPLTGTGNIHAASEILEGIKYAVSEFNSGRENKIGLLIKDTGADVNKIDSVKRGLDNVRQLKAILGPVFSKEVIETLKLYGSDRIVIMSPTATDDGLTNLYDSFFQANPSFTARGRLMAQYIYFVENKRNIAVLNAIEGYSPQLASSFITEFEKLGGKIIIKETYKSGNVNIDAAAALISADASVEGLYIPLADKIDAQPLLSQLEQKGIDLPVYGDQDWLYASGIETHSALSSKLTFTSDHFIDYNDPDLQEFSKNFLKQTQKNVNRNVLYGYDAAKFLLTVLMRGGNLDAVKNIMESGITVRGYHNNICFDETRINRYLNIIRYREGRYELVDEFKINN